MALAVAQFTTFVVVVVMVVSGAELWEETLKKWEDCGPVPDVCVKLEGVEPRSAGATGPGRRARARQGGGEGGQGAGQRERRGDPCARGRPRTPARGAEEPRARPARPMSRPRASERRAARGPR